MQEKDCTLLVFQLFFQCIYIGIALQFLRKFFFNSLQSREMRYTGFAGQSRGKDRL